jgi:hypothetical protein
MNKQLDSVPVTFDSTDHFDFLCPDCGCKMKIQQVNTYDVPERDSRITCTMFYLQCPMCSGSGHRKVYWNNTTQLANRA